MFTTGKPLKQSGSQFWCLFRVLPFLLSDFVPQHDEYKELIFLLQDCLQIIFAFEVRHEDLDRLETLISKHNELFQKLMIDNWDDDALEIVDVEVDGELEEDVDDPDEAVEEQPQEGAEEDGNPDSENSAAQKKKKPWKVYVTNKLHQIKHIPEMMRRFGPAVRYWCAKFEGRMKIFRMHSSICCNFVNPPKTMAQMFQLSTIQSIIREDDEFSVEYQKRGMETKVSASIHSQLLTSEGLSEDKTVKYTNCATFNGEEYRLGLFVCLPGSTILRPCFGMITDVIVTEKCLYLVTKPWINMGIAIKYNAFRVSPQNFSAPHLINVRCLANFRCMAAWTVGLHDVFLSVRTIMM